MKAQDLIEKLTDRTLDEKLCSLEHERSQIAEHCTKTDELVKEWIEGVRSGADKQFFAELSDKIRTTIDHVKTNLDNIVRTAK